MDGVRVHAWGNDAFFRAIIPRWDWCGRSSWPSQPASRHDTPEAHTRGFLPRPKVHTLTPLMSPAGVSGQVGSDPNSQLTNPIVMGPPRTMT